MKTIKTTKNCKLQTIVHPRYKKIQVADFNDGQRWLNLNDLSATCRTTALSALNSLDDFPELVSYIKLKKNDPEFTPFVTEDGFLLAQVGRSQAYKRNILDWVENETKEVKLPTINQMIVLDIDTPKSPRKRGN